MDQFSSKVPQCLKSRTLHDGIKSNIEISKYVFMEFRNVYVLNVTDFSPAFYFLTSFFLSKQLKNAGLGVKLCVYFIGTKCGRHGPIEWRTHGVHADTKCPCFNHWPSPRRWKLYSLSMINWSVTEFTLFTTLLGHNLKFNKLQYFMAIC